MAFLTKAQHAEILHNYYLTHYGEQDTDRWYEQPAVNVRVFGRGRTIVTLKSHVLTGIITEQTEEQP